MILKRSRSGGVHGPLGDKLHDEFTILYEYIYIYISFSKNEVP